jgi:hypothetical protein
MRTVGNPLCRAPLHFEPDSNANHWVSGDRCRRLGCGARWSLSSEPTTRWRVRGDMRFQHSREWRDPALTDLVLPLDLGVDLCPQQDCQGGEIQPGEQTHDRSERAVGRVVRDELRHKDGEDN